MILAVQLLVFFTREKISKQVGSVFGWRCLIAYAPMSAIYVHGREMDCDGCIVLVTTRLCAGILYYVQVQSDVQCFWICYAKRQPVVRCYVALKICGQTHIDR